MIHTNLPRNCVFFPLLCELTRSAIYGSQKFDSHKWPTVLVDEVKGKPCNFEACLCGSLYSTFTTSFYLHFITDGYKRFSKTNSTDPRQRVPLITLFSKSASTKMYYDFMYSLMQISSLGNGKAHSGLIVFFSRLRPRPKQNVYLRHCDGNPTVCLEMLFSSTMWIIEDLWL